MQVEEYCDRDRGVNVGFALIHFEFLLLVTLYLHSCTNGNSI